MQTINKALQAATAAQQHSVIDLEVLSGSIQSAEVILGVPHHGETTDSDRQAASAASRSLAERLLSAPISATAEGIRADILIRPRTSHPTGHSHATSAGEPTYEYEEETGFNTLERSIFGLAADFMQDEGSEELVASTDELDGYLPGAFEQNAAAQGLSEQDSAQAGLIAQILERLLLRLRVTVRRVTLNIYVTGLSTDQLLLEQPQDMLKFEITFTDLTTFARHDPSVSDSAPNRHFVLTGFQIAMQPPLVQTRHADLDGLRMPRPPHADVDRYRRVYSEDDLAMSMATADLRKSVDTVVPPASLTNCVDSVSSAASVGSDEDLFHSVTESFSVDLQNEEPETRRLAADSHPRRLFHDVTSPTSNVGRASRPIFWFVSGSTPSVTVVLSASPMSHHTREIGTQTPSLDVAVEVSAVETRLDLSQINCLLAYSEAFQHVLGSAGSPNDAKSASVTQVDQNLHLRLAVLKVNIDLQNPAQSTGDLGNPQLVAEITRLEAVNRSSSQQTKVKLHAFAVGLQNGNSIKHAYFPIMLPDPRLAWMYHNTKLQPGQNVNHTGDWSTARRRTDSLEWLSRTAVPADVQSAGMPIPLLQDAVAVRRSGLRTEVTVQPVHIWLDTEVLHELTSAASLLCMPQFAAKARPDNIADDATFLVRTACVRIDVRCTSMEPSSSIRSNIMGCDLVALRAETLPKELHSHRKSSRPGTPRYSLSTCHFFCVEPGDKAVLESNSSARILWSIYDLSATLQPYPDVQASSIIANLGKASLDTLQYFVDDLGHQVAHLSHIYTMPAGSPSAPPPNSEPSVAQTPVQSTAGILRRPGGPKEVAFSIRVPKGMSDQGLLFAY